MFTLNTTKTSHMLIKSANKVETNTITLSFSSLQFECIQKSKYFDNLFSKGL